MGETFGMIVHDYAGNSKTYTVKVPGNSDDYGIVKPPTCCGPRPSTTIGCLPIGAWSPRALPSTRGIVTWTTPPPWMPTMTSSRNEWLYSRATDISGVETDVHMIFNFYTTPVYTVDYKRCNLQVMASADGQNWEEVWNLQKDAGVFTAWAATQAKGHHPRKVPELRRPALRLCLHR